MTSRSERPDRDEKIIDSIDGEEIPLPPPLRPCEDGLVDEIDWRRDRDEDRAREQERWEESDR